MWGAVDTADGNATIQKDLNSYKKRSDKNIMRFSKGKYQVLGLSRNNPMHQHRLNAIWLENSFADKDPGLHFYCVSDPTLNQAAQWGCGVSTFGDTQNPTGHSWELSAEADPCFEQGLCSRWSPEVHSSLNHSLFLFYKESWLASSWPQPKVSWAAAKPVWPARGGSQCCPCTQLSRGPTCRAVLSSGAPNTGRTCF